MADKRKTQGIEVLSVLKPGDTWLPPLEIQRLVISGGSHQKAAPVELDYGNYNALIINELYRLQADAYLEASWSERSAPFRFILESKARSTPQSIRLAVDKVRRIVSEARKQTGEKPLGEVLPAIQVPYLSPESLAMLEEEEISGVDLCGNGVVIVPGQVLVFRSGAPNRFPDSRTTSNPYRGKSSLVGRALLKSSPWKTLSGLVDFITKLGGTLSLGQASKALKSIEEDLIARKSENGITVTDPIQLIEKLASEWDPERGEGVLLTLGENRGWARALSSVEGLDWAVAGESSATRYASFAQAGPIRVMAENLARATRALEAIGAKPCAVPSFADIELRQSGDPGFYFDTQVDGEGIRWSSLLQSFLELQAGDARQKEVAVDLRAKLIKEISQ